MPRTHTVSVIVPAFNAAATIRRALDSALRQRGCSLDVVVVDDGSRDATSTLLADYAGRIRILRQANAGVAAARNAAIEVARGDFVAFLDADDEWLPTKLERQLLRFGSGVGIVYCGASYVTPTGTLVRQTRTYPEGDILCRLLEGNFIPTSSVVVRAECFGRPEVRFPPGLRVREDYALWIRLALDHRFAAVREPLVRYQLGCDDKYPTSEDERAFDYIGRMLTEELGPTDRRTKLNRYMRANACWNTAVVRAKEGRYWASVQAVARAFRSRPTGLRGLLRYLRDGFFMRPGSR